jgi:predicted anti-sigma-YlaC factor YlaD
MSRNGATSCTRAAAQISLRLDDELSPFEEAELRAHLAACASCRAYEGETAAFTSVVRLAEPERFDLPIVMPRRRRRTAGPLQVGVAAAMLAAVGLGGILGVGREGGILSSSVGVSDAKARSARPAYLDSASYELRLIRQVSSTHAPGGSAVPQ